MKAFVTGGSGFVGRNLLLALRARGDHAVALARSLGAMQTVRLHGAEPLAGDLVDVAAMSAGMAGADVVFHCAAKVDDWGNPAEFHRVNVEGTAHVIEAARAAGVRRLVHVSTEAVLADGTPIHNADETRPRALRPVGLYPSTKAEAALHLGQGRYGDSAEDRRGDAQRPVRLDRRRSFSHLHLPCAQCL
jgi:nucleoside-diphosphate-sugar epimerase